MNMAPSYVHRKIEEKYNEKKSLAVLPHLLVVFTWQLEILVASLSIIITCTCTDSMLIAFTASQAGSLIILVAQAETKVNNIQELYEIKLRVGKIEILIACCFTMLFYIFCMLLITRRNNEWDATFNWNFNNTGKSYKFCI